LIELVADDRVSIPKSETTRGCGARIAARLEVRHVLPHDCIVLVDLDDPVVARIRKQCVPISEPAGEGASAEGEPLSDGSAVHLDLIQEATVPIWSRIRELDEASADSLLRRDLEFLRWQVSAFRLQALVCTSSLVLRHVSSFTSARLVKEGEFGRVRWTAAIGTVGGRAIPILGWNIPLNRPTGLTAQDQHQLGTILAQELTLLKSGALRIARDSLTRSRTESEPAHREAQGRRNEAPADGSEGLSW
jgi:hypothetical protein